jgi:hypothetical protein
MNAGGKAVRLLFLPVAAAMVSLSACDVSGSVGVGSPAPAVKTKTLKDVDGDLSRITTYRYPDERMYQYSIDQALAQHKPILLAFATPGHCTVCDEQLRMLKGEIEKWGSQVIFMHVDQYRNPEAFKAFRVQGDPWTFVIDAKGVVRFKRAGRMLYTEVDQALAQVVSPHQPG